MGSSYRAGAAVIDDATPTPTHACFSWRRFALVLAPGLGLADCIVDLVQSGRTLRENGLREIEVIDESTGRLVVNRASYQLKAKAIASLIGALNPTVDRGRMTADRLSVD